MAFQKDPVVAGPKLSAEQILDTLRTSQPAMLNALPATHGIYGLIDHEGEIRYIGVTVSPEVGFHNRIYSRHVAGSEGYSHKFSHAYNSGRLWQDRREAAGAPTADGKIAKRLRAQFCRTYCRAVYYEIAAPEIAGHYFRGLTALEAQVQALAPASMRLWEGRNFQAMEEPEDLLDTLLNDIDASAEVRSALLRQSALYFERSPAVDWPLVQRAGQRAETGKDRSLGINAMASPATTDERGAHRAERLVENIRDGDTCQPKDASWFVMRPECAQAYGKPVPDGFLVQKGSTAMVDGSPRVKRNAIERDRLVRRGVLVRHEEPGLFVFTRDHVFNSSSEAGGIIKDGNCSGPSSWRNVGTGKSLRDSF